MPATESTDAPPPDGLGLYVHVPFCRTRCRYCDFYRVGENRARIELFLAALEREVAAVEPPAGRTVDSIFVGGGTPSLLTPEQLAGVLAMLRSRFTVDADCEVSIECNPSDLSLDRLLAYRQAGANRVSLGVQAFCDRELELLGRRHDARRAADAVGWARTAGFERISLDLMLGIPGQTAASFRRSTETALALAPDHLSVYILEVHAGSEIDGLRRQRPGLFPSDRSQCRRYQWLAERCVEAGWEHYEISNFARPGARSRHNLKYWRRHDVIGFGPSAHSILGRRRWSRPRDLAGYLVDPTVAVEEPTDPSGEEIFLGLRLSDGLAVERLADLLDLGVGECDRRLDRVAPWLERRAGRVRFTIPGYLLSNAVLAELLDPRGAA